MMDEKPLIRLKQCSCELHPGELREGGAGAADDHGRPVA
jgi:hypothetical protein